MIAAEFQQFETAIRRLEKLFSKKIDDETIQAYWRSLKDLQLPVFVRFVERHEKYGKFFPKPSELRAKEDKLPDVAGGKDDAAFKEAEARCIRNLEELRKADLEEHRREVGRRQLDRIIATQHPGSSLYEAALNEWKRP
jgi:hypothetical protein